MGRLIFVGLGLAPEDLTDRGRKAIASADELVAEFYTSRLMGEAPEALGRRLGRPVRQLARSEVEGESRTILEAARRRTVAFLCAGDPMTATTHSELRFRAQKAGISVEIVHGVSIQTVAAGAAGLQSYKFDRTTTLARARGAWRPESPLEVIEDNLRGGLHTLVLLDPGDEAAEFLGVSEAARLLIEMAKGRPTSAVTPGTLAVGLARLGHTSAAIRVGPLSDLAEHDLGGPLHCLIVPGRLHFAEEEALSQLRQSGAVRQQT